MKSLNWRDVFFTDHHKKWGHIDNATKAAYEAGYKYVSWNGRVYKVMGVQGTELVGPTEFCMNDDYWLSKLAYYQWSLQLCIVRDTKKWVVTGPNLSYRLGNTRIAFVGEFDTPQEAIQATEEFINEADKHN